MQNQENKPSHQENKPAPNSKRPNLLQVFLSVIAAMFGVQSSKAHDRDFKYGNPIAYIVVGIITIIVFVLTLFLIVRAVISSSLQI